jgi:hypothetical protein
MLIIAPKIHNISQEDRKIPDKLVVGYISHKMPRLPDTAQPFIITNKNSIFRIFFLMAFYLLYLKNETGTICSCKTQFE